MGAYQYVALDEVGKECKGILEGETPRAVRQALRERKLFPVEVVETRTKENILLSLSSGSVMVKRDFL